MRHKRELAYVTLTEEDILETIRLVCSGCNKVDNQKSAREWLSMKNRRILDIESRNKVEILQGLFLNIHNSSYLSTPWIVSLG